MKMEAVSVGKLGHWCDLARGSGASDVFFSEGEPPKARIDGKLSALSRDETILREDLATLWQLCGADPRQSSDHDAHWSHGTQRYRVNLHRHGRRLGAVLRLVLEEIPDLEVLGLPVSVLQSWAKRSFGLILVTGATGSGKSTTVASLLEWLNSWRPAHVVTIEEPVEYVFRSRQCHFTQREIPMDVADYTSGLRSGLRQSPDIIFMGEVRDFESAKIAIQAAETGHLVITTLHTTTVVETMERLTNLVPAGERAGVLSLLASQLIGVMCQKLLLAPKGGRVAVSEYFQNEAATRDWIREMDYVSLADFLRARRMPNNRDFLTSLRDAWLEGRISREVALAAAPNPNELERLMRGIAEQKS